MKFFACIALLCAVTFYVTAQHPAFQHLQHTPYQKVDSLIRWAAVYRSSDPSMGLQYIVQAIRLSEEIPYPEGMQKAYRLKGRYEESLQQLNQALTTYRHALSLACSADNLEEQVYILNRIANVYRKQNKLDTAIFFQEKAVQLAYNIEDSVLLENSLTNLGYTYWLWDDLRKALFYYQEALQTNLKYRNRKSMASRYYGVAYCLHSLGKYQECVPYYLQAIAVWREDDNESELAKGLQHIGEVYRKLGYLEKAVSVLEEAIFIYNNQGKREKAAYCHMILGHICVQQQQFQVALKYYQNALAMRQEINNTYGIITSLISIGIVYRSINDYPASLHFFRQAWKRNFGNQYPDLLAYTYDGIARTQMRLHQPDSSIYYFNKALTLRHQLYGAEHPDVSIIHTQLAKTYLKSKTLPLALEHAQQALSALGVTVQVDENEIPHIDQVSSHPLLLDVLTAKAEVLAAMHHLPEALQHYQWSISYLMNQTLEGLDFSDDQLSLIDRYRPLFEGGIHTAYTLYSRTRYSDYLSDAFALVEASRGFLLREGLQHNQVTRYAGVPDALLQQEKKLKWALTFHEKELYAARQAKDTVATIHHRKKVLAYQEEYNDFKDSLVHYHPDYYQLSYDTAIMHLAEVQSELGAHEILLSYFVGDHHLYIFSLTQDTVRFFKSNAVDALHRHVTTIRKVLTDYSFITDSTHYANRQYIQSATWLFRQLIQPVLQAANRPIQTLTIIPDGILNTIPFEALLTTAPEDPHNYRTWPYLIRDYAMGYSYTTQWPKSERYKEEKNYTFTGFAPDYHHHPSTSPENNPLFASLLRDGELPLPEAEAEVKAIADIMGGRVLTNATAEDFSIYAPQSQIVHFSGHALVDDQNNDFSNLVFSLSDTLENHYLYAADIYNMPLDAEMAVLSTCNSGYGKVRAGEGMMSLARAFAYAGCQSLVTSLWKVPDKATKNIMVSFYTHLATDVKKDQALRQAKLQYLKETSVSHAHPFYWAGFIAIGDMTPIRQQENSSYWFILGLMILLPVGILMWRKKSATFRVR